MLLEGKRVLITGGTGSLGSMLVAQCLSGKYGTPEKVVIFSRDEAKQHYMQMAYRGQFETALDFRIGDVRDYASVASAIRGVDLIFNAAAMKQVPTCEYFPFEAVQTNVVGAENIVRAIRENQLSVESVAGISTDKACKPINVMGMTKAIQERIFVRANLDCPDTRFICVRYGNVLASRGSVLPLFHDQIRSGGPVTITTPEMTRFLITLERAVDTVFAALQHGEPGEIYVPQVPAARVIDIADVLIGDRPIKTIITGIRPGEKVHEILVSEEETHRTTQRGAYYVIVPMLPELRLSAEIENPLAKEFSSADNVMTQAELDESLRRHRLMVEDSAIFEEDLLA